MFPFQRHREPFCSITCRTWLWLVVPRGAEGLIQQSCADLGQCPPDNPKGPPQCGGHGWTISSLLGWMEMCFDKRRPSHRVIEGTLWGNGKCSGSAQQDSNGFLLDLTRFFSSQSVISSTAAPKWKCPSIPPAAASVCPQSPGKGAQALPHITPGFRGRWGSDRAEAQLYPRALVSP